MEGRGNELKYPTFRGEDFLVWKSKVLAKLNSRKLEKVISEKRPPIAYSTQTKDVQVPKPDSTVTTEKQTNKTRSAEREREKYVEDDLLVRSDLLDSLDTKIARQVISLESSKAIWERLVQYNEQRTASNRARLQREFFELRMRLDEKACDYISRAEYLSGQLLDVGVTIDEPTLVGKIVAGLPRKFKNFMNVRAGVNTDDQTINQLIDRLMTEESIISLSGRPIDNKEKSSTSAFVGEVRKFDGKSKHFSGSWRSNPRSRASYKKDGDKEAQNLNPSKSSESRHANTVGRKGSISVIAQNSH